jgi:hypothetical protein
MSAVVKPIDTPLAELVPDKVLTNLRVIRASRFYGRITLIFEDGLVVRSELLVSELHHEKRQRGKEEIKA